jgi:hypothetical protein
MGDRRVVSPIICKAQHRLALRHRTGAKRRAGAPRRGSSDPMIGAGGSSTSGFQECYPKSCARPTGGSHALTTDDPAQRAEGARRRPRRGGWGTQENAAKGIISAGALSG